MGIAAVAVMFQVGFNAPNAIPGRSYYNVTAQFADANNLTAHYQVRVAGRLVGQVLRPRVKDGKALVDLQLDPKIAPLRADTTLRVRPRSPIGVRFVDLKPGRSGRVLEEGDVIPLSQTSTANELDTVLGTLDVARRKKAQTLMGELGEGTLSRGGDIATTLDEAPTALNRLERVSRAVNARPGAPERFVRELQGTFAAIEPVRGTYREAFAPAADALRPIAAEERAVGETFSAAGPALRQARSGLASTDPLLDEVDGLAEAAVPALRPAPAALRQTTRLLARSRTGLKSVRATLDKAEEAVPPTLGLLDTVDPILPSASTALTQGLPTVDRLGAHGCDFGLFVQNWGRIFSFGTGGGGDGIGEVRQLRLQLTASEELLGGQPTRSPFVASNPYPKPCDVMNDNEDRR
ncbi:MlaD family protein [Patulibacter sp. NPDC049589]|uniref:MlaD family protein n=1 Tax=Patulibacter sp. NPDC049589 TaxID=3154731 RepID=UPI003424AE32